MSFYARTDLAILAELGHRLATHRLRRNITQAELAARVMVSVGTIQALERGQGKLSTFVALLRELGLLHELEGFLEPPAVSPLQMAAAPRTRKRARPSRAKGRRG
jgi:transcriptional regulator with XRE-family HTH domain